MCRGHLGGGICRSNKTAVLSERLHRGQALGGRILLAVATNLPELAITVSGMSIDSIAVLLIYAAGAAGLVALRK